MRVDLAGTHNLRTVIETSTAGEIACYIAEPIQGAGGITTPPDGFFAAVQSVLNDHDIPFVSDEPKPHGAAQGIPTSASNITESVPKQ
ncbi:aminotransferase class III-fold pyridoxal phosphate-dependent enzyme [Rhodococcus qingshengii]|uniref:aminotransferase class III-fold pyridoxal phosphate-dependent enzyme n=1 Tax=Rhodococcus qingshengii TaxID=334542 RepID=UPI0036DCFFAE